VKAIVAVDENWGIGQDGKLLFTIPADMAFFKEKTQGKVVVMGYFTFVDLPGSKPLKNRTNIVLYDGSAPLPEGVIACGSSAQLFEVLRDYDSDDVFFIGGQAVYEQFFEYCTTVFVTKIKTKRPADRHFPNLDALPQWSVSSVSEQQEHEGLQFAFYEYTNRTPGIWHS